MKGHPHYVYTPPPAPFPRPSAILTVRYGRLPRQSYPPQTGCFKLPTNDPLTTYLAAVAKHELWDEWDYCWGRLKYLPRWDLEGIWECPTGWITPHSFITWTTWHLSVAHGWLHRLKRHMRRSHSLEDLLMSNVEVSPVYQFVNKQQVDKSFSKVAEALRIIGAGNHLFMPTPEVVTYPPDGLWNFMKYIELDNNLADSIEHFDWHESRARHKCEFFVRDIVPRLTIAAKLLKRHLGESGWSE